MGSEHSAIARIKISQPANLIASEFSLDNLSLDYGCGRGKDASQFMMDKYDPHFHPTRPTKKYKYILCTYVLNVVDEDTQEKILDDIFSPLRPEGKAFISVRRDIPKYGKIIYNRARPRVMDYIQRYVVLKVSTYYRNCNFETYIITKP